MSKLMAPIIISTHPQNAGNLGALARVMSNFNLTELRIVGDFPTGDATEEFSKMDWAMACKGEPILTSAKTYVTLAEAIGDCHCAMGTSGKTDAYDLGYSRPFVNPEIAFQNIQKEHSTFKERDFRWAIVLGCESDGLTAEEASHCQQLIQIPTADTSPSINMAMAAGMLIYHWHLWQSQSKPAKADSVFSAYELEKGEAWSTLEDKERFIQYAVDTLKLTQFFKYPDELSVAGRFRRFFQSLPMPRGELLLAFEALYQLKSWGQGHFEKRNFLKD